MTAPHPTNPTPPDLLAIEAALDRLAQAEARSMPADLPGRIVAAAHPASNSTRSDRVIIARLMGGSRARWRAAASLVVLLAGASTAGWLATRSPNAQPTIITATADAALVGTVWSAVDDAWSDDAWARTTSTLEEVNTLRASMDAIAHDGWSASNLIDEDWLSEPL